MRIHILGICGTFMSGVALLAKECGHKVTGSDANVYPPMSTQLEKQGICLFHGYEAEHIPANVDCVIVGNVIKRGNPSLEYVLNYRIPFISGPQWLAENILHHRFVLAVSGTHGKTTTTSLLTWILHSAGLEPGFLIGGIPENFQVSARLGKNPYFVIEADEYDSAFHDKRSKFIHYQPQTLIFNNLEYDHADIFVNLEAIKQQFSHLIRTIPNNGLIIKYGQDVNIDAVLQQGCWSPVVSFGDNSEWSARLIKVDGSQFTVYHHTEVIGDVCWDLLGMHNVNNALAALAAAHHLNIPVTLALQALSTFKNVKRRLEVKAKINDIIIYDDFAHHPTAIAATLAGLRAHLDEKARLIAILEFGSYTMRSGVHKDKMQNALENADMVICKSTEMDWGLDKVLQNFKQPTALYQDVESLVAGVVPQLRSGDHVVIMSNSGFGGIYQKLVTAIKG